MRQTVGRAPQRAALWFRERELVLAAPAGSLFLIVTTQELIELAGQRLAEAAGSTARVILFGSAARGELTRDSDLDFLVIERDVENRVAEAVRLRDAVGRIGWPVDVIVMDEYLAERRAKVRGTMVHHALREGRIVARSDS